MKRNNLVKRIAVLSMMLLLVFALAIPASAQEIYINGQPNLEFDKLMIVEDGVAYLPIRMLVTDTVGANAAPAITEGINMGITAMHGENIDGTELTDSIYCLDMSVRAVNSTQGNAVRLEWDPVAKTMTNTARYTYLTYETNNNGKRELIQDSVTMGSLQYAPLIVPVSGHVSNGVRVFLAADDLVNISAHLFGENYATVLPVTVVQQ